MRSTSSESDVATAFDVMLNPDTSKGQWAPDLQSMTNDAFMLFLAGTDTTAITLVSAVYNLLRSPCVVQRLVAELRDAMPEPSSQNDWASLAKLPYLVSLHHSAPTIGSMCKRDTVANLAPSMLSSKNPFASHMAFPVL